MAILSSTGISGFLSSAKATGKQILNKAGKLIPEYVEDFVSGFAGHGWKIWNYRSEIDSENNELKKYKLEIDSLTVRESMTVFELLIQKIRAVKGALSITQASGKVATAVFDEEASEWLLTVEDEMSFAAHDIIRCQSWDNGTLKGYWVEISEIRKIEGVDTIVIPAGEFSGGIGYDKNNNNAECVDKALTGMITPAAGDEIIQFGNSKVANRQSAVYIHADEGGQPAIDILFGITTKSFAGCVKTRIGGDIPGGNGAKGFYCENGMIKCVDDSGSLIYEFKPDGSFTLGKRKIVYDPTEDKLKFGAGVTLTWDNIADDAKDHLKGDTGDKGEKGDKGDPGINGADGVNGEDGISLLYKGELDSHPANPRNGWYYRNTIDKKCYVYQDGAWYVMTVDGADGKNGMDGINGKDGNDGLSVVWKGDSSTPPANPQKNWCYRDTDNGRVYIYNGSAWELMIADGNDGADGTQGADGLSVFITYNDDPDEVELPTGEGTTDGWHTDATRDVVWMSQKVAESAASGTWGNPVKIKGNPGDDAVIYEIITPVTVINYVKNQGPYPDDMKLSVRKTIGNTFTDITTDAAMASERLTLKYLNPMGEGLGADYEPWSINETMSSQYFIDGIKLRLYRWNSLVSHKELPLVMDGRDGDKGDPGESVYRLDLTNENVSLPCTSDGFILSLSDLKELTKSVVQLYLGTSEVTNAVYGVSLNADFNRYVFNRAGNGMEFALTNIPAILDKVIATFTASVSGVVVGTAKMTITKVCAGNDGIPATMYYLVCYPTSFRLDSSGNFKNGDMLTVKAYKKTGTNDPVLCSDGEVFISVRNDGDDETVTSESGTLTVSAKSISSSLIVLLKDTGRTIILDNETIPILADGQDGQDGSDGGQGLPGLTILRSEWHPGIEYRNDEAQTDGLRYLSIVLVKDRVAATGWRPYKCLQTHISDDANMPGNTAYWEELAQNIPSIYTPLVIADNAKLDFLSGNEIRILNANDRVTAGVSGSGSGETGVRFYAGSDDPQNAPFRVDENGKVIADNGEFRGTVYATDGFFSNVMIKRSINVITPENIGRYVDFVDEIYADSAYININSILGGAAFSGDFKLGEYDNIVFPYNGMDYYITFFLPSISGSKPPIKYPATLIGQQVIIQNDSNGNIGTTGMTHEEGSSGTSFVVKKGEIWSFECKFYPTFFDEKNVMSWLRKKIM